MGNIKNSGQMDTNELINDISNKLALDDFKKLLSNREREVMDMRLLSKGRTHTLREVAEKMGVSCQRIRQIEGEALKKLRFFIKKTEKEG